MNTVSVELMEGRVYEVPVSPPPAKPTIDRIIRAYAQLSGAAVEDLVGRSQAARITALRHELMYLIRRIDPAASFTLIGRFMGGRDMATVHEAIAKVEQRLQRELFYADQLEAVARQMIVLADEEARAAAPLAKPWQLLAATQILRDGAMTDAEARKAALSVLQQLEAAHG